MPEFPTTPLVNHFEIEIGGTPSRDKPEYWATEASPGHKWMAISDFGPRRITETAEQVSESGFRHSNAKRVSEGTLMMSFKLTIGRVAFAGCDLLTNEAIAAFVPKDGEIVPEFLYHVLPGVALGAISDTAIKGATLNKAKLRKLPIPKPVPSVQRRIAKILTTVDNQIEKTEALIAKYQSIKQGLMHDLFTRGVDEHGRLRPRRDEAPQLYKESELGWIPKDWDSPCIRDIAPHVGSGVTPTGGSEVYLNEGVLFIRSQNVDFDGLLLDDVAYISPRIHEQMQRSEIFPHDVLLNITGASIGRVCPFPEGLGIANVNQHVCAIRTHAPCEADAWYLASVLASPIGQNQIFRLNAGGNREGLNYAQIRSFRIPWPKPKEREVVALRLQSIGSRQMAEQRWLLKLRTLKLGLMQDLLTGKVPVKPEPDDQDKGITPNGAAKAGVKSRGEGIHA